MPITEQEISDRLAAAAAQVGEPRFGTELIARRIRRQRARLGAIAGASMAVVAVIVAAVLASPGADRSPERIASPGPQSVWLPIRISMFGQTTLITRPDPLPRFVVPAGRPVPIIARVTVPRGVRVQTLWLGITTVALEAGGPHGPTGWTPILLHTTRTLSAGERTFRLRWDPPRAFRPGKTVYLIAYWVQGPAAAEPIIAKIVLTRT